MKRQCKASFLVMCRRTHCLESVTGHALSGAIFDYGLGNLLRVQKLTSEHGFVTVFLIPVSVK